jgi:hypothetical protein
MDLLHYPSWIVFCKINQGFAEEVLGFYAFRARTPCPVAEAHRIQLFISNIPGPEGYDATFAAIREAQVGAVLVPSFPRFHREHQLIIAAAMRRMPAIYEWGTGRPPGPFPIRGIIGTYVTGIFANLLYGCAWFHLQNTSQREGVGSRGSADHLCGLEEERRGDGEAQRLDGLEVDDPLESCGLQRPSRVAVRPWSCPPSLGAPP